MAPPNFLANAGFLKLYWSVNGQLAMNVYGVRIPTGVTITQTIADALGSAIKSAYTTHLAGLQTTQVALYRVGIRDYRNPNMAEFRDTIAPAQGTAPTTETLPAGVALVVTLRTGKAGKSFRGRSYVPGFAESQNTASGVAATTASTGAVNFVTAIGAACSAQGMFLAVMSRPSERVVLTETTYQTDGTTVERVLSDSPARVGAITDVTRYESRTVNWEYQRRRDNARGGAIPALAGPVYERVAETV